MASTLVQQSSIFIAMPTVLSVTMAIGSLTSLMPTDITKRMTAIEEMVGMDVLCICSDKTGTLTLNKLTVDKNLVEVFERGITQDRSQDHVIRMTARASPTEYQDAIDTTIVGMLADPKEARTCWYSTSSFSAIQSYRQENIADLH